jgi:hypothetical protein
MVLPGAWVDTPFDLAKVLQLFEACACGLMLEPGDTL